MGSAVGGGTTWTHIPLFPIPRAQLVKGFETLGCDYALFWARHVVDTGIRAAETDCRGEVFRVVADYTTPVTVCICEREREREREVGCRDEVFRVVADYTAPVNCVCVPVPVPVPVSVCVCVCICMCVCVSVCLCVFVCI